MIFDGYLVFFIEILSREESKIMIKFLFTILSSIYYVINTILSSMIVCKKNEIFDERLDTIHIQYILDSTVRIVKLIFHKFILFLWRNKNIFIDLRYFSRGRHIFQDFNKFCTNLINNLSSLRETHRFPEENRRDNR